MWIYHVTVKIVPGIREAWLHWMQHEHIQEVLATGMFDSFQFFELIEPQDEEGFTFSIQYCTTSQERYQQYIESFAPSLRQKGFEQFGDQFLAFRSILKKID
ncbi:MAG: DUF4286 family protein [Chitinophagaceae bacterium]|nr:DUF4286 family protein [Chitinophagaceae bacterium]